MSAPNPLAAMFRLYRIGEHKSLRELGIEIGVAPATVHRIEQGKPMDLDTWLAVQAWILWRPRDVESGLRMIAEGLESVAAAAPVLLDGDGQSPQDEEEPAEA